MGLSTIPAYVANLDSRVDRLEHALRECDRVGITAIRLRACSPEEARKVLPRSALHGGNLGLAGTFLNFLSSAKGHDSEWVLFFEDDVKFRHGFSLGRLTQELSELPITVGLSRFGFLDGSEWVEGLSRRRNLRRRLSPRMRFERVFRKNSYQRRFRAGTHAMAVRINAIEILQSLFEDVHEPLDHVVYRLEVSLPDLVAPLRSNLAGQKRSNFAGQKLLGSDILDAPPPPIL